MADFMGTSYVVDYCVMDINRRRERANFDIYVTDVLGGLLSRWCTEKIPRYYDLIHPAPEDKRTGQEIADDIIAKYGLKVVD